MKKEICLRVTVLSVFAALFFTGCAAHHQTARVEQPALSNLAFVPVTHARELTTWAQDFPAMRAIETTRFVAPEAVEEPLLVPPGVGAPPAQFPEELSPGEYYVDPSRPQLRYHRTVYHRPHSR